MLKKIIALAVVAAFGTAAYAQGQTAAPTAPAKPVEAVKPAATPAVAATPAAPATAAAPVKVEEKKAATPAVKAEAKHAEKKVEKKAVKAEKKAEPKAAKAAAPATPAVPATPATPAAPAQKYAITRKSRRPPTDSAAPAGEAHPGLPFVYGDRAARHARRRSHPYSRQPRRPSEQCERRRQGHSEGARPIGRGLCISDRNHALAASCRYTCRFAT